MHLSGDFLLCHLGFASLPALSPQPFDILSCKHYDVDHEIQGDYSDYTPADLVLEQPIRSEVTEHYGEQGAQVNAGLIEGLEMIEGGDSEGSHGEEVAEK